MREKRKTDWMTSEILADDDGLQLELSNGVALHIEITDTTRAMAGEVPIVYDVLEREALDTLARIAEVQSRIDAITSVIEESISAH